MKADSLGIVGYDSYSFTVENLARSRSFYTSRFGFREVAQSTREWNATRGEQAAVFGAGEVRVVISAPLTQSSASARYLRKHPAGVSSLAFRVHDADHARAFLEARHATFLGDDIDTRDEHGGRYRRFAIATPLGDVSFQFVERNNYSALGPGFESLALEGGHVSAVNPFGIERVDHVTANGRTMGPIIAFYRDVLGMEEFWNITFHTEDVSPGRGYGTGLKSIVMRDADSGVKFATNEPLAPYFESSQVAKFVENNRGPGVQHIAFAVPDIVNAVTELRGRQISFLSTPACYYRCLPERLKTLRIHHVNESLERLAELEILLDGADNRYMLQIFLREAAATYGDERAGPFFYELIQRAGDQGFGYGNFRALFESIEREQRSDISPPG